jgi:hypothetical protein
MGCIIRMMLCENWQPRELSSGFEERPTCVTCGRGKLDLIDERPDPIFGVLGMTYQTLKCDSPECGKVTIV